MTATDIATVLEAVGDSWPAAIVVVAIAAGVIAWRALPRLKEIRSDVQGLRHEMEPNSGATFRDSMDRIERTISEMSAAFDAHIVEARERDTADAEWKRQIEEHLTDREV